MTRNRTNTDESDPPWPRMNTTQGVRGYAAMDEEPKPSILDTVDEFMACIPQGDSRAVLVYRRQHGGREYIRWRIWHKHRKLGRWYPDKRRRFIVPLQDAKPLAQAIVAAVEGKQGDMPDWLARREAETDRKAGMLEALNAPPDVLGKAKRGKRC